MQTSGFWMKLGRCSKFSQPCSLSVFEITVFVVKMSLSAAQGRSAWFGLVHYVPLFSCSGWEPAVSYLQNHLWGEDGYAAAREDGVSHYPSRAAGPL